LADVKNCFKDENAKAKRADNDINNLHELDRASPPAQVGLPAFVHYPGHFEHLSSLV
jgi:hypothetical protein